MSRAQMRADFTVKGANTAALVMAAKAQANTLAGVGYEAEVVSLDIHGDVRVEPLGEYIGWRADVVATLRERTEPEESF